VEDRAAGQLRTATEQWFLARGTPHFIEGYRASEDVFTRALPLFSLVFVLEVVGAANLEWPWWQNLLALAGGFGVLFGGWAVVNRLRGRPALQRPDDVGVLELAAFVVVPALVPLVFGGQVGSALLTAALNLVLIGLVYLVAGYALIPLTRWALGQTLRQVGAVLGLFGRAMPLLLLFSIVLLFTTEVWQVATALDGLVFWAVVAFFVLIGLAFLLIRLPGEVGRLTREVDDDLVAEAAESPLADVAADLAPACTAEPLSRRQRGNVLLVLLFSQAVQVLLVTVSVTAFFFVFGLVAVRPDVIAAWVGDLGAGELARWTWFGHTFVLTRALLHVAGLLGTLSGFYFTVYVITDATYREEFFDEILGQVRQTLAVRTLYLALLDRSTAATPERT